MSAVIECKLSDLQSRLPQPIDFLFCSASYEERSYGVCQQLFPNVRSDTFVCYNANHISYLQSGLEHFKTIVPSLKPVALDSDRPLKTFNAIRDALSLLKKNGPCHVALDISCFTREAVSMFLFLIKHEIPKGSVLTALYHKASSYGRSRGGGWLTEGVREVRTILGYSGSVSLSADTHLVLLSGFEYERAQEIVDAIQPARISLGYATPENSVSAVLNLDHESFLRRLEDLYPGTCFDRFDFSCIDPFKTRKSVLDVVRTSSNQNVVAACLNTKPATCGVCLAALNEKAIQLVYAQPVCYNIKDYSKASGSVLLFNVPI
jgi:hypothetical protein